MWHSEYMKNEQPSVSCEDMVAISNIKPYDEFKKSDAIVDRQSIFELLIYTGRVQNEGYQE